ncbi:MAG: peptide-methionine (R)-S-oxide reductase [Paracoccaceae bacterium]
MSQTRRDFLAGTALAAAALPAAPAAFATTGELPPDDDFQFEVQRSDEEWRSMLTRNEYVVLRKGSTDLPKSNPLWEEKREGEYYCRGCNLHLYTSFWKEHLDMGWVFFQQSVPNAVLMGIDGKNPYGSMSDAPGALVEAHCRRCGSHLGHVVSVKGHTLSCINGTSLVFRPATA